MDTKVSFLAFCNLCEHLSRLHKIEQKKQKLCGFIEEWRRVDPLSLYSFIRLLLPHLDNERENYGLKETRLAEMYISALALPRDSQDANSLRNWQQSKHKDFSDALYEVLKKRLGEEEDEKGAKYHNSCNLRDVNELLDQLTLTGENLKDSFLKLTAKMSANEQKWLIRIVLKSLRVGLPDGQVLKLIHPDAPAVFDVRMNLSEVVSIFSSKTDSNSSIEEHLKIKLFSPFKPMLAEREALERSVELLSGSFYIEPKLDGERCQLHYSKTTGQFRYFSRQGTEYTYLYGRTGSEGSLTPKIVSEGPFIDELESVVLDGEMVVYDPLIDKFLPFGTLKTSAGTRYDPGRCGDEPHPCLVIFDVVYWNGQSLLKWSLEERSKLLKTLIPRPVRGYFELIQRSPLMSTAADITEALDAAVQDQVEGLILKDPNSLYVPAHRSSHWIKIKPEYVEGMCDDLDLVIMGAWYGRAGNIKAAYGKANEFLCGIWTDDRSTVLPFVKIGSGYNSHEWSVLNSHLEPVLIKSDSRSSLISELKGSDRPDLVVSDPHRSVVIQVKGSQIVASGTYKSLGLTLRFPRFIKLRLDRAADSSLKVSELNRLNEITAGTLAKRAALSGNEEGKGKRQCNRAKGKMAMAIERTLSSSSLATLPGSNTNTPESIPQSSPLEGYTVLVLNGSDEVEKTEFEQKVLFLGGKIVQSPPSKPDDRFFAVAGKDCGLRVKNLRAMQTFDIVDGTWLLECEKKASFVNFKPKHFIYLTEGTKSRLSKTISVESNEELRELLKEISIDKSDPTAVDDICREFKKFGIEVPKCTRGIGQFIPVANYQSSNEVSLLKGRLERLKIEYIRARWG